VARLVPEPQPFSSQPTFPLPCEEDQDAILPRFLSILAGEGFFGSQGARTLKQNAIAVAAGPEGLPFLQADDVAIRS
jgi:hypothetical protein